MKRLLSIPFAVALICAAVAAQSPTLASAAAPHGTLTKVEYKQLRGWIADETIFDKTGNFKKAAAACKVLGSSTAFLQRLRSSCSADLVMVVGQVTLIVAQSECAKAATSTTTTTTTTPTTTATTGTTTTTPTTTTGTSTTPTVAGLTNAQLQEYVCLNPVYEYVSRNLMTTYAADTLTRKAGIARGLKGQCLDTMVSTAKQLRDEEDMISAVKRVVLDIAQLAKVQEGQAPASAASGGPIKTDVGDYNRAFKQLGADSTANKLFTCPHQ